jgi:hypothetical protein
MIRQVREVVRAEWFSPKDFVRHAILISLVFAAVHAFGLREFTSVLNGTTGAPGMSWETAAALGVTYVLAYLAFVLLVPALLLAAIISFGWRKLANRNGT